MNEFDLIARYLSPLAGEGAFGLRDDAALHGGHVITKDLLVDGVHFRTADGWGLAFQKALRANVSDILAMGAKPAGAFLGVVWPETVSTEDIAVALEAFGEDLERYDVSLLGGDTTRHTDRHGPLTISLTLTGVPAAGGPVLRSGAAVGDLLMVTNEIGEGALGLRALREGLDYPHAVGRYLRPEPPFALAGRIGDFATAAIDVSDGLVQDAGHIATASSVGIRIDAGDVPLSADGRKFAEERGIEGLIDLLTGGDDYQLLMAVPPSKVAAVTGTTRAFGVDLTVIGAVTAGEGVVLVGGDGAPMKVERAGHSHF